MAQLFKRRANAIAHAAIAGGALIILGACGVLYALGRSDYWTRTKEPPAQPVPFSHEHHVAALGIDCRYCHTSVEKSSFAGMPPTETCMTCHSQVWKDAGFATGAEQYAKRSIASLDARLRLAGLRLL